IARRPARRRPGPATPATARRSSWSARTAPWPRMLDDQAASRAGYERLRGDGFGDLVIPVWQARPAWDATLDAAANGRLAARDPTLRAYADQAPMVAIGGLVHAPCPRAERHRY